MTLNTYETLNIADIPLFTIEIAARAELTGLIALLGRNKYGICTALNRWTLIPQKFSLYANFESGLLLLQNLVKQRVLFKDFIDAMMRFTILIPYIRHLVKFSGLKDVTFCFDKKVSIELSKKCAYMDDIQTKLSIRFTDPHFNQIISQISLDVNTIRKNFKSHPNDAIAYETIDPVEMTYYFFGVLAREHTPIIDFFTTLSKSQICKTFIPTIKAEFKKISVDCVFPEDMPLDVDIVHLEPGETYHIQKLVSRVRDGIVFPNNGPNDDESIYRAIQQDLDAVRLLEEKREIPVKRDR